jgi:hypothetical protein
MKEAVASIINENVLHQELMLIAKCESNGVWSEKTRNKALKSIQNFPNIENAKVFLQKNLWPIGLQESLFKSCKKVAVRFFLIDNSG